MSGKKCVLIFGRSLNLAGIYACLKHDECFDVLMIDPQDPIAKQHLNEIKPETIIFDLNDSSNDLELQMLRTQPGILLIGVDATCDEVIMFRGQRSKVVTASELIRLITNHTVERFEENRG